jgi:hypothetical protein
MRTDTIPGATATSHSITPELEHTTPNAIKDRDPELFQEVKDFRARFDEIVADSLDNVLDNPVFRDRGRFLPRDDLKTIAGVLRILTRDDWSEENLDQFDSFWRQAMQSDFFVEAFETIRFRIRNAVETGRNALYDKRTVSSVSQGTLW